MNLHTRVTELLNINYPIIQGGLAHLAYANLAAAVSNAGGLGQITAMSLPSPEHLRDEITKVRQLTNKPFGVIFAFVNNRLPLTQLFQLLIVNKFLFLPLPAAIHQPSLQ